jgi:hypothetical protein
MSDSPEDVAWLAALDQLRAQLAEATRRGVGFDAFVDALSAVMRWREVEDKRLRGDAGFWSCEPEPGWEE